MQHNWHLELRSGSRLEHHCINNSSNQQITVEIDNYMVKGVKSWMTRQIFLLFRIRVSQNLPESNKSLSWAGNVVKNTVKCWNSQMNFHSVEIFLRDVNSRKRHHSESTLLHLRTCAMGSQSPISTPSSHFCLLGSRYELEMGPKAKTNTYGFTWFTLVLTLVYVAIKVSDADSVTEWIYSPKTVFHFQLVFVLVINSQTTALIAQTGQQYVCNLVLSMWLSDAVICTDF